jgi:hypothetical protein
LILVDVIHLDRRRAERESTRRRTMAPMALPLPRPAAVLDLTKSAVGQAAGTAAALAAIPARAFGVLDSVEALVKRINVVVDRVEATLDSTERILAGAEESVRQVGMISAAANVAIDEATEVTRAARTLVTDAELVSTAAGSVVAEADRVTTAAGTLVSEAMARAELIATTADELLTAYETTLRKGAPMASRFIEQLSPEEVDAAIRLIDELPKLTEHLTSDVLPILATLDRVGPDIHDLLEVTRDLKLAVAGIPGLKLLRRRGDRLTDEAAN